MTRKFPTYEEWRKKNGGGTKEQYQGAKAEYDRYQVRRKENQHNYMNALRYYDMPIATQQKQEAIDNLDAALSSGQISQQQYNNALKAEFKDSMIQDATLLGSMALSRGLSSAASRNFSNSAKNYAAANKINTGLKTKYDAGQMLPKQYTSRVQNLAEPYRIEAEKMAGRGTFQEFGGTATKYGGYGLSTRPAIPNAYSDSYQNANTARSQTTPQARQSGDLNGGTLPEVIITPKKQSETISQKWTRITGLPWSEAKKRGFTTGSYDDNIRISRMLDKGYFDKENAVYWNNQNEAKQTMYDMMVPAYEQGISPYQYASQKADAVNYTAPENIIVTPQRTQESYINRYTLEDPYEFRYQYQDYGPVGPQQINFNDYVPAVQESQEPAYDYIPRYQIEDPYSDYNV